MYISHDLRAELQAAVERLPERQRALVAMAFSRKNPGYEEISAALGMPIGSIGPTRGRALQRLRADELLAALAESDDTWNEDDDASAFALHAQPRTGTFAGLRARS
jgi:DNA-directed RNA polymerase specialized sigma24 family protein